MTTELLQSPTVPSKRAAQMSRNEGRIELSCSHADVARRPHHLGTLHPRHGEPAPLTNIQLDDTLFSHEASNANTRHHR